jgi:hypothetical protein
VQGRKREGKKEGRKVYWYVETIGKKKADRQGDTGDELTNVSLLSSHLDSILWRFALRRVIYLFFPSFFLLSFLEECYHLRR